MLDVFYSLDAFFFDLVKFTGDVLILLQANDACQGKILESLADDQEETLKTVSNTTRWVVVDDEVNDVPHKSGHDTFQKGSVLDKGNAHLFNYFP